MNAFFGRKVQPSFSGKLDKERRHEHYHAFRENPIWSLEHEGEDNFSLKARKHGDTDRMKVMKAKWALNAAGEAWRREVE